jgi:cysteine desulfurase / selenocysteine lyase
MRYYLDHAATSWPKPPGVLEALVQFQSENGVASGRGIYRTAMESDSIVQSTRRLAQSFLGAASPREIAFCQNGTFALNATIMGIALSNPSAPPHIVTTSTEHNSVLRPLALAAQRGWITWDMVHCDEGGFVSPDRIQQAIKPNTKWIIVNHASNVSGAIQDLQAISNIAKEHGCALVVDAAQTVGYHSINVERDGIDILACPGHKGLCGMLGTGILYVRSELQQCLAPFVIGGTGESSDRIDGEFSWQSALESGNVNVPAIAALQAGIKWKQSQDPLPLGSWTKQIIDAILASKTLRLVGPFEPNRRVPVVSVAPKDPSTSSAFQTPQEMALFLDSAMHVECRAGFHCAGAIHDDLLTKSTGGTLRFSLGPTSTQADVDAACDAIQQLDSL